MKSTQLNIENDTIVVNEQRNIKRFDDKFIIFDGFWDTTNFFVEIGFLLSFIHFFFFFCLHNFHIHTHIRMESDTLIMVCRHLQSDSFDVF